ncbi:MAG: hypothetical protein M3N30_06620 [Bacteroidota bacterium]|nr:hypothetical protein [Bacteroidota bacterium]
MIVRPQFKKSIGLLIFTFLTISASAQDNYEIQVYASPTQAIHSTMFELHSNYTFDGRSQIENGVLPSNHSLHETLEITTGITSFFEIGAYLFTNYTPGYGYQVIGTHIRPRVMLPTDWGIPFGVSLSLEFGYQKPAYASQTWSLEIRPIVDKQWGKFYISVNPTLGVALKSQYSNSVPTFEPNVKLSYAIFKNTGLGIEYYGEMGYITRFDEGKLQNHALFITYDLLNNSKWEFNAGAGFGVTPATDPFVLKVIVGRKIKWK